MWELQCPVEQGGPPEGDADHPDGSAAEADHHRQEADQGGDLQNEEQDHVAGRQGNETTSWAHRTGGGGLVNSNIITGTTEKVPPAAHK